MSITLEAPQNARAATHKQITWPEVIFLSALIAFIIFGIRLVPFHGDESTYIWMSQDYDRLQQGRLNELMLDQDFDLDTTEHRLRLSVGSILEFSIGLARDVIGMDAVNNDWDWGRSWEENLQLGGMPDRKLLMLARACSALMGALGIVFLFLATRLLFDSRIAAGASALFLATQGDILVNFRRAMQEGPKFLFLLLTVYLAAHILRNLKAGNTTRAFYIGMGIASGMTLATKQDTAPLLTAVYVALACTPFWERSKQPVILANLLYLGAAGALAYASFLALMPVLWGWWTTMLTFVSFSILLFQWRAWNRSWMVKCSILTACVLILGISILSPGHWRKALTPISTMIELRKSILKVQLGYRIDNDLFYLNSIREKAGFLLKTTLGSEPMYMEVNTFDIDPIHEQIAAYEASPLSGRTGLGIAEGLIAILFLAGLWTIIKPLNSEGLLVLLMFLITAAFLFLTISLPWQRYFLIMQIPYSLIAAVGAGHLWTRFWQIPQRPIQNL